MTNLRAIIRIVAAVITLVAAPVGSSGQVRARESTTPMSTVRQFLADVRAARWEAAAAVLAPREFAARRERDLAHERSMREERPGISAELMRQADTSMPAAAAEYFARMFDDLSPSMADRYAGVESADSIEKLPLAAAGARWLEAKDRRYTARRSHAMLAKRGCRAPEPPPPEPAHLVAVATAIASDSVAFVLIQEAPAPLPLASPRAFADSLAPETPDIIELRRRAGRWWILPSNGLLSRAGSFIVASSCDLGGG